MPAYITEPTVQTFPPVTIPCVMPSAPNYSFGSLDDYAANAALGAQISSYSITSNVVTFTVTWPYTKPSQFSSGNTVVVSGVASPNDFLNGSYSVTGVTSTTFTAALTQANVSATAITGEADRAGTLDAEVAENIPANGTAGRQFAVRAFAGLNQNSPAVTWETKTGGTVSAISVQLQGAIRDHDADYATIDTSTATGGEVRTVALGQNRWNFLRIRLNTSTNTNGTIIAKFVL